jgi:hypothetical protein
VYFQNLKPKALGLLVFIFLFLGTIPKVSGQYVYNDNQFIGYNGDTGIVSINLSDPMPVANRKFVPEKKMWNGPYRFQSQHKKTAPTWENRNYIEIGYYTDGIENGEWTYTEQTTALKIEDLQVSGLKYRINTVLKSHKGNWRKGVRYGDWSYEVTENPTDNKQLIETLNYKFENGWLNGPIAYENKREHIKVSGQFAEGMMVGDWTWNYSDSVTEHRLYEKGVLISLETYTKTDTQQWMFPLSTRCLDALKSRDKTGDLVHYPMSLTFSDGYPKQSPWVQIQKNGLVALEYIHERISAFLPNWKSEMGLAFGTNRCIYPLSGEEELQLSKCLELRQNWELVLNHVRDTLSLVERYPQQQALSNKLRLWLQIQENRLNYTQTWREIMETGRLVYYNREGQLFKFAQDLLHADTLHYKKGFELIEYPSKGKNFMTYLVENTQSRIDTANFWLDSLIAIQKRYELSKFMLQLSAQIQSTHDSLLRTCIVDTLPYGLFYGYLKDVSTLFLGEAFERRYQSFLSEAEIQKEQSKGDSLLSDLKRLDQLRYRSVQLNKLWRFIDTFYTEQRIDAFTFERLKVRTKKRFYEQLVSYTRAEIALQENLPLSQRLESTQSLRRIFQSFLGVRDRQTNAFERKLMKAKNHAERRAIWESLYLW